MKGKEHSRKRMWLERHHPKKTDCCGEQGQITVFHNKVERIQWKTWSKRASLTFLNKWYKDHMFKHLKVTSTANHQKNFFCTYLYFQTIVDESVSGNHEKNYLYFGHYLHLMVLIDYYIFETFPSHPVINQSSWTLRLGTISHEITKLSINL